MSPEIVGLIGVLILVGLLFSGLYIGVVMAMVGLTGIAIIAGTGQALSIAGVAPFSFITNYSFSVAPMFMLMGNIVSEMGIGADLYYAAHRWFGQLRGGLAIATTGASALFSAITGDTLSGVIVFSKVALPEMKKFKYSNMLTTGTIAAGATLGPLIPPSVGFVIYGIMTEQSIGKLFIAGIIPGILQAIFYMITIYIWCRFRPNSGPPGPVTSFKEKMVSTNKVWPTAILFLLVMGGIYGGIFTTTEAGALGAFGAIIVTIVYRKFTRNAFLTVLSETGLLTAMFMLIMMGAPVFMKFMAISKLPFWLGNVISGLGVSPIVVLVAIVIMYIFLGSALPGMMVMVLTIPIIYPVIIALGFDPIWFGVLSVRLIEIGEISPPEGMNVFILSGISGVPVWTIFKGLVPFLIADFFHIALLVAVPSLSLFLPNSM